MILILQTSLIISLFTCGLNILFDYREGEPKRFQMLFFRFRKILYENRKRVETIKEINIANTQEYYRMAINSLQGSQEVVDAKRKRYEEMEDSKILAINKLAENELWYEWYLKPILLCVYCMPSFWGSIIWFSLYGFNYPIHYVLTLVSSVFINGLIWNIYNKYDNN
jgi:hypothetical protein